MARTPIQLVAGEAKAASAYISSRELVNCFLEAALGQPALYGGPGFASYKTLATAPVRGWIDFNDVLLVVAGNRLYTITEAGTVTDVGQILGAEDVECESNGLQAIIIARDASLGYIWDGTTLATIIAPGFFPAASVAFLDQYFITGIDDTGRFQLSGIADGTAWSALDIETAESLPDNLIRVFVDNRDLLLMGAKSIEGQYNSGNANFPFERSTLFFQIGVAGRDCVASVDNSVAFLANDGTVRIIRGGTPLVISTPAIAETIGRWTDPGAARALAFAFRNHQFWALRHNDGCVVWDASAPGEDSWHVRRSYGSETWRVTHAVTIWGRVLFADATGKIYTMDPDVCDEAGEALIRSVTTGPMGPGGPFTLNEIEVLMEPGVGVITGQGSDPDVWLELSRNGGKTFGARMTRKAGMRGEFEKRIIWSGGFGQFRPEGGVVRVGISDPVQFVIKGAQADYTVDR